MTTKSIQEYAEIMRQRYIKEDKKEKGKILDEFIKVTGYHRKSAIRVLLKIAKSPHSRRGRPSSYSSVVQPLKSI
jgi:hypothetical protein